MKNGDDGVDDQNDTDATKEPYSPKVQPSFDKSGPAGAHTISHDNFMQLAEPKTHVDNIPANTNLLIDSGSFPELSNDAPVFPKATKSALQSDAEDDEPATEKAFPRSTSSSSSTQRNRAAVYEKVGERGICHMHKFWLYETASRYHVVGGDVMERKFRILKINRRTDNRRLSISEDDIVYGKKEMNQLLNTMDDGNKTSGGMKLKYSFWGLLGFVRFTGAYYMLLITKRSAVAVIGGHYIYQIDGTELVPLTGTLSRSRVDKDPEEARFIGILNNLDLTRSFYFSYSYDITRTLQHNILRERRALRKPLANSALRDYNAMFVWNHHLLKPASAVLRTTYDWCLPIIHGFVDQASTHIHDRP